MKLWKGSSRHRKRENWQSFGKPCVINSLGISKLIYDGSVLPIPEDSLIKKIKSSIFNFIWDKRDRIKRDTLKGKVEDGGIGLVDVDKNWKQLKLRGPNDSLSILYS